MSSTDHHISTNPSATACQPCDQPFVHSLTHLPPLPLPSIFIVAMARSVSTFALVALVALSVAVVARGSACGADLVAAGEDLGKAAANVGHAVTDCGSGKNATGCAST